MPGEAEVELDSEGICRMLAKHGVEFIVIGGVAGTLHGSDLATFDFGLVPKPAPTNLDGLAAALVELHAEVLYSGRVLNLGQGEWLTASKVWNFRTDLGRLDVMFAADGGGEFSDLAMNAKPFAIEGGLTVLVASLDDLIAMKEAAGRNKDLLALPILRWLRDRDPTAELEGAPGEPLP
ncbi:MAG: hypothetical protein HYX53_04810 [Chloroflexi bacterium]|nr:hypothetical protein [Chloroflexota bacterium]